MFAHGNATDNICQWLGLGWQHYHQKSDTPDKLNYAKMARITDYVASLARSMGSAPLTSGKQYVCDTSKLEIACIKRTFGPLLPLALKQLGLSGLKGRRDCDALAHAILGLGL